MTTPYQKYIAFILLTGLLLQSCNMEIPVAGQIPVEGLNNTSEECERDLVLSEIHNLPLDAQNQEVQPEGRQASSHHSYVQLRPQRNTAPSIASSGTTRECGGIKAKRLVIRRKNTLQGGFLYEKDRDATESSVARCVEDNIVVTWKGKPDRYEDTATCSIFNPSSCKMEPLSASQTATSGEVAFPLNLSTTQSPILFEAEIKRTNKNPALPSPPSCHIVIGGLSEFMPPNRYGLKVYTSAELPFTIPAESGDSVKIIHLEEGKVSEKIEALKNQTKKTTQERAGQTDPTVTTDPQERAGQTDLKTTKNCLKWLRRPLLYGSVFGTAGLAVTWFLIKKPVS